MIGITINEEEGRLVAALSGDLDNVASSQAEKGLAPVSSVQTAMSCSIVLN